jgi:rhodanese-related sulfurtransferase
MKPLYKLAAVLLPLGILIAAIPAEKTQVGKTGPEEILAEMKDGSHLLSTDAVADLLVQKDPVLQLIDVRSQEEYEIFHLPGAVHVPLSNILAADYSGLFDQDVKMNVLYANGTTHASQAWVLLRQQGYGNLYVMQGGLNYWAETIMNPVQPPVSAADDELARYDFRKAAGGALGGGSLVPGSANVATPAPSAPKAVTAPKKKKAAGGC